METRQAQTAPKFSFIWGIGLRSPEIINTVTAKPDKGISTFSKQKFATRFMRLYKKLPCGLGKKEQLKTYMEAKSKATTYNVSKKVFLSEHFVVFSFSTYVFISGCEKYCD